MTYTAHTDTTGRLSDTGWHVITAIAAVAGVLAAAIGAFIGYGADQGTVSLFAWTWSVADLHELWAPLLMLGGGFVAAISMGWESIRDWGGETSRLIVAMELIVALAGVAALVFGVALLF